MRALIIGITVIIVLSIISMFLGFSSVTLSGLLAGDEHSFLVFFQTRVPRTIALILSGASLALAGMIMQMLTRNRFVEPSTAGTVESASLGILVVMIFAPGLDVILKMLVAALFALFGSLIFMFLLRQIPLKSVLIVPLTGIMLGYVIGALTNGIADQEMLLPSLQSYLFGSFSMVVEGKYELLWLSLPLCLIAYLAADRFTVAGFGEDFSSNLGLDYKKVMLFGLVIISMITATVICTVGRIPFIGLVVPNIVSIVMGDNMRRTAPFVMITGAGLVLTCDILGRLMSKSAEIPVGTIMGVLGSVLFIALLLKWRKRLG
ncbi:iron chelate uptake ABC transporter family permease subunit [Bartonella sp. B10834G6]|uniref:ABC transporter permease n=1 Tax=Bartonella apis TaxID=1686310 RepID=UPI00098EE603|nr:iron chelate uptake ABC transporter family permease subunit [Bartonella apihabitans]MBH9982849.1 iron chelate uptake ABC transporter family permease subunit [Bartonella apis]MBI0025387.1 iron chelate uptake ABC transporter family permease subunit [Bartonella apihabitans]MBI0177531.1 iron chelate uptake ABC transporter family permease subunit [Bartonella apis]